MRMTKRRRVYETVRRLGVSRPCLLISNGDLVQETVDHTEKIVMRETVPLQRIVILHSFDGRRGDLFRLNELLKDKFGKSPAVTVQALAYKILTRYLRKEMHGNVLPLLVSAIRQEEIARAAMGLAGIDLHIDKIRLFLKKVSGAKKHLFYPPFSENADRQENEFFKFYKAYEEILHQKHVFDYEDVIGHAFAALRDRPSLLEEFRFKYRYMIVYNYQQLTYAQKSLLALLTGQGKEIGFYAVGSDDYHLTDELHPWNGALDDFRKDYPLGEIVIGDAMPHTTKQIASHAYSIIKNNNNRFPKNDEEFIKRLPDGENISAQHYENAVSELKYILSEVRQLREQGVPLEEVALIFLNPKFIPVFARLLKELQIQHSGHTRRASRGSEEGIYLSTIPTTQNQFFDYVFLIGLDENIAGSEENGLNNIFSGMTRCRKKLFLTMAEQRSGRKMSKPHKEIKNLFKLMKDEVKTSNNDCGKVNI